jgi:16S rRNA U516 pseudouridylate synthase RsuA-like enzyme
MQCLMLCLTLDRFLQTSFAGLSLKGLVEGEWIELTENEMKIIQRAVSDNSSINLKMIS